MIHQFNISLAPLKNSAWNLEDDPFLEKIPPLEVKDYYKN